MFGHSTITRNFALAYPFDSAFETDRYVEPGMDDDAKAAAEKRYMDEFRRCVETQDYKPLCRAGESPTIFRFRTLRPTEVDKMMAVAGEDGSPSWLAFRLGLVSVENAIDEFTKFEKGKNPRLQSFDNMVTPKSMDVYGAASLLCGRPANELVYLLGSIVIERSTTPSPL